MKFRYLVFLAALAMALATPAWASYSEPAAGLQCRGNTIAIRFGRADNGGPPEFEPLPQKYDEAWADVVVSKNNSCTLANGDRVELHAGAGIAYPWGMGGGDPDGFFRLWINGRKAASREVYYHGYGSSEAPTNSLFLAGKVVERCVYRDFERANDGIDCFSQQIDIAALAVDPLLPSPAEQALVGTYQVAGIYSPDFCQAFLQRPRAGSEVTWESIVIPAEAQLFHQSELSKGEQDAYYQPHSKVDRFDLWNTGRSDTVVQYRGDWKFFNGDVYFYRAGDAPDDAVDALRAELAKPSNTIDMLVEPARKSGWQTLPANPDAATHWTPFHLSGTVLVLEEPAYAGRIAIHLPLHMQRANPMLKPVCEFRMIEEYF